MAARFRRVLLGMFSPLGAYQHAPLDAQASVVDGRLGVLRAHGGSGAAHHGEKKGGFVRFQEAGGEHLVDQRPATGLEHAAEFAVGATQVLDEAQDIAAPDQVSRCAGDRQVLGGADLEADGVAWFRVCARDPHAPRDRIDTGDPQAEAPGELDSLLALAASDVDHDRPGREPHARDVFVQGSGACRRQGLVQRLIELRLDAVERVLTTHQLWRGRFGHNRAA
jgi:hypothetical protein